MDNFVKDHFHVIGVQGRVKRLYGYRLSLRDGEGWELRTHMVKGYAFDVYEDARNEACKLFGVIADVADMLEYDTSNRLWIEIINTHTGAVHWELMARDATGMNPLPF